MNFLDIEALFVSRAVLQEGQDFLRAVGATGREGLILWVGKKEGPTFYVTELFIPEQRGLRTRDGVCVIVEGHVLAKLNADLFKRQLQLIAQIHSHPGEAYHSSMDDEYAIATKVGCLSLVVPDFASRPFSFRDCAIYRLNADGQWNELSGMQISSLLHISGEGGYYGAC